ncbi:MAG: exo-alpha-sialidase, partial [Clostridia bacterium]|nr:exo-alpha-sialidase [Clostridia bacterium]
FACKYSDDGCKTWSEEYVIGPIEEEYCRSHGVFYNAGDTLYAFAPRAAFGRPTADINYPGLVMEAYKFNPADRSWTNLGVVLNDGFWPLCEPMEIKGGKLLMAGLDCKTGAEQAAIAIADKNNPLEWEMIVIPNKSGIKVWGESTVIDYGDKYVLFCRTTAGKYAVSESTDGINWSSIRYTDLLASNTKAYGGTLSTGSRYLIYATESRKHHIIAIGGADGSYGFSKFYYVRSGFDTEPQFFKSPQWAYPYAVEEDGKLYVVYSEHKENCELAIIPIESLDASTSGRTVVSYHNAYTGEATLPDYTVITDVDIDGTWYSGDGVRNGYTGEHIDVTEIDGVKVAAKTQVEAALTQTKKELQVLRKNFDVDYSKVKNVEQLAFVLTFWSAEDITSDRLTSEARLFFGDTSLKSATSNPLNLSSYNTNSRVDYRATTAVAARDNLWGTIKKGWNTWIISFGELSATENFDTMNTFFMIMPSISGMDGEYLFAISSLKIVEIPCDAHEYVTDDGENWYCKICKQKFASFLGDVDLDGKITVKDAMTMLSSIVNENELELADVDNDGTVNLVDVIKTFKRIT